VSEGSPQSGSGGQTLRLITASFIVLGLELALIRWLPSQVRVIAYFPNLILISAFLGLGVGCLLSARRVPLAWWPPALLLLVTTATLMNRIAFTQSSASEHLWLLYNDLPRDAPVVHGVRLPILAVFVLSAATFVPLGHTIANALRQFKSEERPLTGYTADLTGSLLGVLAFSLLFFAGTFPWLWFSILLLAGGSLYRLRGVGVVVHVFSAVAIIILVWTNERATVYSPYYAITAHRATDGLVLTTNGSFHQRALPLRRDDALMDRRLGRIRDGYHLPYRLLGRRPRKVLVLGAGTGNDVAVALDEGADQVDAVEIDPAILRIGRLHPDRPYASPRVRTFNTDARAYLNHSADLYDLIVFGTLDSQTRLSALSNVRLDNFVYTSESLRAARRHLTADGGLVLYFSLAEAYIDDHIVALMYSALGEAPAVVRTDAFLFNRIYLSGPAFGRGQAPASEADARQIAARTDVPTDDWPFLYLSERGVSSFYLSLIGAILLIAVAAVFTASPAMRKNLKTGAFDTEMFCFGVAFLLLETKLVTEMNLVWGATWLTSAVVFGSILLMVLIGTLWTARYSIRWTVAATGLIVAVVLNWAIPARVFVGFSLPPRLLFSVLFAGIPILFASLCFAILFQGREHPEVAFGWNMLGAVAGGLIEFSSMAVGIKATTLLALAAYLAAMYPRRADATGASSAPKMG